MRKLHKRERTYIGLVIFLLLGFLAVRNVQWQGSIHLHTTMEVLATILSLLVGVLALIRYYSQKNLLFLFIGTGFFGTAFLDGYHAVVTSEYFLNYVPSPPESLLPWSWFSSRLYLSVMMFLAAYNSTDATTLNLSLKHLEIRTYVISAVLTIFSFGIFSFVPLPIAYIPGLIFHRPEEFIPGVLFLIALLKFWQLGNWQNSYFSHWLMISLIVNVMGQILFISISAELFDSMFDLAHLLKKVSYITVMAGLLIGIYNLFLQSKKTLSELGDSNLFYTSLVESIPQSIIRKDNNGVITYVNQNCCDVFGKNKEELIGKTDSDLFPEKLAKKYISDDERIKKTKQKFKDIEQNRDAQGNLMYVHVIKTPILDENNKPIGVQVLFWDITEQYIMEDSIQKSNILYTSLVENIPQNIIRKDANGVFTYVNHNFCELMGKTELEIIGKTDFDIFSKELATKFISDDQRVMDNKQTEKFTETNVDSHGKNIFTTVIKTPLIDMNEKVAGIQIIFWDITKEHEQEEELKKSEEFTKAILDSLSSNIAIINEKGIIIHVNQAWKDFVDNNCVLDTNTTSNHFLGVNYLELCKRVADTNQKESSDALAVYHGIEEVISRTKTEFYYQYTCHSPTEERWFNLHVTRLKQQNVNNIVIAHENITEQKKLEQLLYQSQKMEAVGQMASGIAHDFNNFHWIIKTNAKMLMSELDPNSESYEDVKEIIEVTERASSLTKELVEISKKQEKKAKILNVNETIENVRNTIEKLAGNDISISIMLHPEQFLIQIEPNELTQIIVNLITNACEAMPSGGELTIETSVIVSSNNNSQTSPAPGKYIKLSIRDTGIGMTEETKSKIFNPFFTTKDAGKGTGLGLSSIYGIVEQSGGYIEVETMLDVGTTIHVYFPLQSNEWQ